LARFVYLKGFAEFLKLLEQRKMELDVGVQDVGDHLTPNRLEVLTRETGKDITALHHQDLKRLGDVEVLEDLINIGEESGLTDLSK